MPAKSHSKKPPELKRWEIACVLVGNSPFKVFENVATREEAMDAVRARFGSALKRITKARISK